jgi:hypothetical protein
LELSERHSVFVGFKLDGSMRRQLESLDGPDRKYVSTEESTFLTLCKRGGDSYVGKIIEDGLTSDRVDDVRRNVLSIVRRLLPDTRLPEEMEILVCLGSGDEKDESEQEKPSFEGF